MSTKVQTYLPTPLPSLDKQESYIRTTFNGCTAGNYLPSYVSNRTLTKEEAIENCCNLFIEQIKTNTKAQNIAYIGEFNFEKEIKPGGSLYNKGINHENKVEFLEKLSQKLLENSKKMLNSTKKDEFKYYSDCILNIKNSLEVDILKESINFSVFNEVENKDSKRNLLDAIYLNDIKNNKQELKRDDVRKLIILQNTTKAKPKQDEINKIFNLLEQCSNNFNEFRNDINTANLEIEKINGKINGKKLNDEELSTNIAFIQKEIYKTIDVNYENSLFQILKTLRQQSPELYLRVIKQCYDKQLTLILPKEDGQNLDTDIKDSIDAQFELISNENKKLDGQETKRTKEAPKIAGDSIAVESSKTPKASKNLGDSSALEAPKTISDQATILFPNSAKVVDIEKTENKERYKKSIELFKNPMKRLSHLRISLQNVDLRHADWSHNNLEQTKLVSEKIINAALTDSPSSLKKEDIQTLINTISRSDLYEVKNELLKILAQIKLLGNAENNEFIDLAILELLKGKKLVFENLSIANQLFVVLPFYSRKNKGVSELYKTVFTKKDKDNIANMIEEFNLNRKDCTSSYYLQVYTCLNPSNGKLPYCSEEETPLICNYLSTEELPNGMKDREILRNSKESKLIGITYTKPSNEEHQSIRLKDTENFKIRFKHLKDHFVTAVVLRNPVTKQEELYSFNSFGYGYRDMLLNGVNHFEQLIDKSKAPFDKVKEYGTSFNHEIIENGCEYFSLFARSVIEQAIDEKILDPNDYNQMREFFKWIDDFAKDSANKEYLHRLPEQCNLLFDYYKYLNICT